MLGTSLNEQLVSSTLRARKSLQHTHERLRHHHSVIKPAVMKIRELEKFDNLELTEGDIMALFTTGELPIENQKSLGDGQ